MHTTYHTDHGLTVLIVWWTGGPSWRTVRALLDNYAAVRAVGLYPTVVLPAARPLVDYIFLTNESYHAYENHRADVVARFYRTFCIGPV